MELDHPLTTIGITCFNAADTIGRAIESALAQTWPNYEIVIIDDYSQDQSVEIIKSFQSSHPFIRLIQNAKNKGVAYNRQILLEEAKGKFLAFFDDDDWSFPDRIEKQMARLRSYAQSKGHENIFCYGDRITVRSGKEEILQGIGREPAEPHGLMIADMVLGNKKAIGYSWGLMGSGTMLAPVGLMRELGGFDASFRRSAEIDLAIRAVQQRDVHFISVDSPVIKQYWTQTPDKSLWRVGKYQAQMILKHWRLVLKRGLLINITYPYIRYFKKRFGLLNS